MGKGSKGLNMIRKFDENIRLSVVLCVHNEEAQLGACLSTLKFSNEIVVLLDQCTDRSRDIAERFTDNIVEGEWPIEGARRNRALELARGEWILEVDADERVPENLALEILEVIEKSNFDWHEIPVDNYIGKKLVRWGWGASFGKAAYPGLFRNGVKTWGMERVHPSLQWSGQKGPMLSNRLDHYVDRNISDMIRRLDNYSTRRAQDLREGGTKFCFRKNLRRLFSRFFKCYIVRKGYREGGYGFLIATFAGLYPIISHLKAFLEEE